MSNYDNSLLEKYGRKFPKNSIIFKQGDLSREIFILQQGKVKIYRNIRNQSKTLTILSNAGDFFGEMSFINNKPRSATAQTLEETTLIVLEPEIFEKMLFQNPEISFRFIKKLAQRLDETDLHIENILLKDPESRFIHFLINQSQDNSYELPLTLNDIAEWLDEPYETLTQKLDKFIKKGFIQITNDGLKVLNRPLLSEYLEFIEMKKKFGEE
ncbi:MAG: Crp/Fnr family transcriptional regulator [Deltaproteobacteria bacterium]|nr:Crp/Fnr family transcriptional regulator [Deltaproteobacteria bacterium]